MISYNLPFAVGLIEIVVVAVTVVVAFVVDLETAEAEKKAGVV